MQLVERLGEHYEVEEVASGLGRAYKWCPERLVLECDACGKRTTLKRVDLISSGFECGCGKDHAARIREEVILKLLDEEYEAQHHPWRYWQPPERVGIPD